MNQEIIKAIAQEVAKTISTSAIWLSVACILTFGVFRLSFNGDEAIFVGFLLPALIVGGAVLATWMIWRSSPQSPSNSGSPPTPLPPKL